MVILIDTSAWVEFDRHTGTWIDQRVRELLTVAEAAATEPVMMEVLAGARTDEREEQLRSLLAAVHWLPVDQAVDNESAARHYRRCRRVGVTPRGLVDCLVAAVALRHGVAVLAKDRDFEQVAAVLGLDLIEP